MKRINKMKLSFHMHALSLNFGQTFYLFFQRKELMYAPRVYWNIEKVENNFYIKRCTSYQYFNMQNVTDFETEILNMGRIE